MCKLEIKFKNGSEIKTLERYNHKPSEVPMLIGVDMCESDSEDYSCINYYCSSCKKIVSTCYMKNSNDEPILPAYCPHCNVRVKGWIMA